MKKRILVSAYFAKNVGDDLFLKVLFDRYPHVQWDLLTANRNYQELFKDYDHVRIIYSYRDVRLGRKSVHLYYAMNNFFIGLRNFIRLLLIVVSFFLQSPDCKLRLAERVYLLNRF